MARKKSSAVMIDYRHWILVTVVVAFAGTNGFWYEAFKAQDKINEDRAAETLLLQRQIDRLQACVDSGDSPCDNGY